MNPRVAGHCVPLAALALLAAASLLHAQDAAQDQLKKLREENPERYRELYRLASRLRNMPAERRQRIESLQRALDQKLSGERNRLNVVMARYQAWLSTLGDADRERVNAAQTNSERLAIVKDLRRKQWLKRQPKAVRAKLEPLSGKERDELIQRLQAEEKKTRDAWTWSRRFNDELNTGPLVHSMDQLPAPAQTHFKTVVKPRLTKSEEEALRNANGHWPDFPHLLVELADRHRAIPGQRGPTHVDELKPDLRDKIGKLPRVMDRLKAVDGLWPEFGMVLVDGPKARRFQLPGKFFPDRLADFGDEIQRFCQERLLPILTAAEKKRLSDAEGHWPEYPRVLNDLAQYHGLVIPGTSLAGPVWDRYREYRPVAVVPDDVLLEFARDELTPARRAKWSWSLDPVSREELQREYIAKHPDQWLKIQLEDLQKRDTHKEPKP